MSKLTKQEKKFVEIKAETGNGTLAAKEAFDIEDSNYAGVKAHDLLRNPKIIKALDEALPDDLLQEVHLEGLNASFKGEPDYSVRHKYLDSAYKIKGAYAPEKQIIATIDVQPTDRVISIIDKLTQRRGA